MSILTLEILFSLIFCEVLMFSISIDLLCSWRLASTIDSSLASTTVTISFDEIKDDTGVALFVAEGFLGLSIFPLDRTSNWVPGPV